MQNIKNLKFSEKMKKNNIGRHRSIIVKTMRSVLPDVNIFFILKNFDQKVANTLIHASIVNFFLNKLMSQNV